MAKNFSSVLKLVESPYSSERLRKSQSDPEIALDVDIARAKLSLPAEQPHPRNDTFSSPSKQVSLCFDKIFPNEVSCSSLYKQSAKEIVGSALLGYHATVITLSSSETEKEKSEFLWSDSHGIIQNAINQIFYCLKRSKKSQPKSSVANLVILCSYVVLIEEDVRDLLFDFSSDTEQGWNKKDSDLPPSLTVMSGKVIKLSQHVITASSKVKSMLRYGREMKRKILNTYTSELGTPNHQAIFTLTVEYSHPGSINAPISGTLSFIDIAASDPLGMRQKFMVEDVLKKSVLSLFTFADVVESLTSHMAMFDAVKTPNSAFNPENETSFLPFTPSPDNSDLYKKSILTQLMKESVGGNCKTLLITYIPAYVHVSSYMVVYETLKLASRARIIQNSPNKRDLAEKALMSAYLRGLEEMYGKKVHAPEETHKHQKPQVTHVPEKWNRPDQSKEVFGSQDSINSDDIDQAYDQIIDATEEEERQRNMQLAATALVAAALEDKGEESDEGSSSNDESENAHSDTDSFSLVSVDDSNTSNGHGNKGSSESESNGRKTKAAKDQSSLHIQAHQQEDVLSNSVALLNKDQNITLEALVAILQDPDEGVSRPSFAALKDVKIKKDAGALFSGAAIVEWLMTNISGVKSEEDAQMLGQLLLDKGEIFHTEGSRVFANAESLFYHARYARCRKTAISPEEILSLLQVASPSQFTTDTTADKNLMTFDEVSDNLLFPLDDKEVGNKDQHSSTKGGSFQESIQTGMELKLEDVNPENENYGAATESIVREEWMTRSHSDEEEEEAKTEKENEPSEPNTAPLERIPSIHTLENTENYPHPLHMAAAIGKSPGVIRELIMMFGVNKLDNNNRTPLMFAALGNNKGSSCTTLLKCMAEVNRQDASGLTALHVACYHGNRSAASILLSNKASIAIRDNTGHTALHWSMVPNDPGCLDSLTRYSMHPDLLNYADGNGLTAVHWSIFYNHSQHLSLLLKRCSKAGQIKLTELDAEGRTFATYAIERGAHLCLKVLLNAESSLLTLPDHHGSFPIHHASTQAIPECLKVLLNCRQPSSSVAQNINATNQHYQRTALHYAVAYNQLESAKLLISKGAQLDVMDIEGKTVMDYALELIQGGKEDMIALLRGEAVSSTEVSSKSASSKSVSSKSASSNTNRSRFCTLM